MENDLSWIDPIRWVLAARSFRAKEADARPEVVEALDKTVSEINLFAQVTTHRLTNLVLSFHRQKKVPSKRTRNNFLGDVPGAIELILFLLKKIQDKLWDWLRADSGLVFDKVFIKDTATSLDKLACGIALLNGQFNRFAKMAAKSPDGTISLRCVPYPKAFR